MPDSTTRHGRIQSLCFRFLDLPLELRDKIYEELLCSFKAAPSYGVSDVVLRKPCDYYIRNIHTGILRVNNQIYHEAYDVMVKTNRFIHVKFFGGLPLDHLLETSTRRIISHHQGAVEAFKGYTMAVSVVPEGLAWFRPNDHFLAKKASEIAIHCMILGQDCAGLIRTLSDVHMPNLGKTLSISIAVAPCLEGRSAIEREMLEPFFNEERTQKALLAPFREKLRGVENVKITGVDTKLASGVREDIAKDEWTDPEAVLSDLRTAKQRGKDLFEAKELRKASQTWEEAVSDIERIHQSSSWTSLCAQGDTQFIDAVVELFFLMCLNITHVQLSGVEKPIRGDPRTHDPYVYLSLAEGQIDRILNARQSDWWRKGYAWEPSEVQLAKLLFRQAMCMKADSLLNDEPRCMLNALRQLELAGQIVPDDVVIEREARKVESEYQRMILSMTQEEYEARELNSDIDFDEEDEEEQDEDDYWEDDDDDFDDLPSLMGQDELDEDNMDMPGVG